MNIVGIIPGRYSSTRFSGKVLEEINGKPMIWHVYNQAKKSKLLTRVIIATDEKKVFDIAKKLGMEIIMTSKKHKTGTDRISEVAKKIDAEIIVNIQGDEPLINPKDIDLAVKPMIKDSRIAMSTLKIELKNKGDIKDKNNVKVVTDKEGFALYFSRSEIPFKRNEGKTYKHIGLYSYRKDFLLKFSKMGQTTLEKAESLEQLRALENGFKIKVVETKNESIGVDIPEDLERVREIMKRN
ncbi:MAG: 3-deoxy-manno-octulosonate cytidylyltransferase [Candidatus Pacearchaeota archaeon]|jgi:3-deoxy-manno-octulosonate cytidylyltransferase (CMP-KDO synthetase)